MKAEILSGQSQQSNKVFALLEDAGEPPTLELQARRRMLEGWALYSSDPQRAAPLLEEAHRLAKASGSPLLLAQVELRQAPLMQVARRFDEADATLRHALELATGAGDLYVQALVTGNLGYLLLHDLFRHDEAIFWFEKSLALWKRIGATGLAVYTVGNLGSCYHELGDLERALASFREAEAGAAHMGSDRSQALWLGNIGYVFLDEGSFPEAIEQFKRALEITKRTDDKLLSIELLSVLARANIESGRLDEAENNDKQGEALMEATRAKTQQVSFELNSANIAERRKQFQRAEDLYKGLVNSASEDPSTALESRKGLADLYLETHQPQKADAQFKSAIKIIEGRQAGLTKEDYKLTYLASLVRFYRGYVDFLVQSGDTDRALQVVESSRARILTERVTNASVPGSVTKARLQDLARSSRRTLLSYWLGPKQSYVWVITPTKIAILPLPPEKTVAALVEKYRAAIEGSKDTVKPGAELSRILLDPIREFTRPGSRLVIVPDGALHSLNFGTLPAPEDPSKYWIEDVTITVAPSLGLLARSSPAKDSPRTSLLAMGDAESPGEDFPRLPNSRREVDAIAALFSGPDKTVFEGAESRPSKYSGAGPARFSFIHFAVHATANRASPLDSALILTREGNKYALTAREISNIPVNANVVTLSACRSAGARAYSGEGLVGLTWAFLQAGAHNVIAGLWDVDDASTSLLMSQMYGDLARGSAPEDALRTAQLSLLRRGDAYRKPYYWGPFQLYSRTE